VQGKRWRQLKFEGNDDGKQLEKMEKFAVDGKQLGNGKTLETLNL
jgi:hypothetical protein